jgi:hypothetical protein
VHLGGHRRTEVHVDDASSRLRPTDRLYCASSSWIDQHVVLGGVRVRGARAATAAWPRRRACRRSDDCPSPTRSRSGRRRVRRRSGPVRRGDGRDVVQFVALEVGADRDPVVVGDSPRGRRPRSSRCRRPLRSRPGSPARLRAWSWDRSRWRQVIGGRRPVRDAERIVESLRGCARSTTTHPFAPVPRCRSLRCGLDLFEQFVFEFLQGAKLSASRYSFSARRWARTSSSRGPSASNRGLLERRRGGRWQRDVRERLGE